MKATEKESFEVIVIARLCLNWWSVCNMMQTTHVIVRVFPGMYAQACMHADYGFRVLGLQPAAFNGTGSTVGWQCSDMDEWPAPSIYSAPKAK